MLSSISPVGEASRRQRWWITATAYTVASTVAGALLGALAGGAGGLLRVEATAPWAVGVLITALLAGAAVDGGRLPVDLPHWRRQVDERWLSSYRGWVYGAGYGAQLGAAFATIVPTAATYVMVIAAVLTGDWRAGALVGGVFGLTRAVPLLLLARVRTPAALRAVHGRLEDAAPRVQRSTVTAQVVLAAVGVVALAAGLPGR